MGVYADRSYLEPGPVPMCSLSHGCIRSAYAGHLTLDASFQGLHGNPVMIHPSAVKMEASTTIVGRFARLRVALMDMR